MARFRPPEGFSYINPCVKYTLFTFNFIFWIIGGCIFGIGVWSFLEDYKTSGLPEIRNAVDFILQISIVVMVFGAIVFLISFAGCLGALRENICLLRFYCCLLLVLFLGEVVLCIVAFIYPNKLIDAIKKNVSTEPIVKYRDDKNLQNFIDHIQKKLYCCGLTDKGYRDWSLNQYFNCSDQNPSRERCGVPFSCCRDPYTFGGDLINVMCGYNIQKAPLAQAKDLIFTSGCIQAVQNLINSNLYLVAGIFLGIAFLQLFVMYLCKILISQIQAQLSLW